MFRWKLQLQDVRRLLRSAEGYELSVMAVRRLRWLEYFLEHDQNVSGTCRHFGIARSTLTCWLDRFHPDDPRSLEEHSRCPHTVRAPETDERVVEIIRVLRTNNPRMGKERIQEILRTEHGVRLSVSTVGRVIARHGLFFADTASHRLKRGRVSGLDAQSRMNGPNLDHDETSPFLLYPEYGLPLS